MKVAFFYHLKFGGAKRVVKDQVKFFATKKVIVDQYTVNNETDFFDPTPFATYSKNYNFTTKYLKVPILGKFLYFYYVLIKLKSLQKKIAGDIDLKKYDAVIVHPDMYTQAPYILRFLKTFSVYYSQEPYRIAYEHSMRIDDNFPLYVRIFEHIKRYIIKVEDRKNVYNASRVVTSSMSVRERMIQAYNVFARVCPPGIDISIFKARGFRKQKNLLFVGSKSDPIDGYDLLEKALNRFPKSKRPKVKFVTWKSKNNERISEKELAKIYETSYVTMCMSRFETFGLIPLESMACGTPVIATDVGGHRETIINGVTGYLVEPEPFDIANAIKTLLDDGKYLKMSHNAIIHVRKNWSNEKRSLDFLTYITKQTKND